MRYSTILPRKMAHIFMFVIKLLLIVTVSGGDVGMDNLQRDNFNKNCLKPNGQFPSNACNKYLNCWNGVAIEQECPPGLLFNPKGYCDHPQNVECREPPIVKGPILAASMPVDVTSSWISSAPSSAVRQPESSHTLTADPTTLAPSGDQALSQKCLKARGQFPSTSCNTYVNCWDESVLEQDCPEGLLFSTRGYCDYPKNVECGARRLRNKNLETPSECPLELGTFRDKIRCNSYYTCISGKVVAKYECPQGFNFNDNIGVCDYDWRVDCSNEPLIFQTKYQEESQKQEEPLGCSVDSGMFRDTANCSVYYVCVAKKIVAQYDCPLGFKFNDDIGLCDYYDRVNCDRPPKIFQTENQFFPQISADIMKQVDQCTPGQILRLNPQCTAVCICRTNGTEVVQCPAGLAYNLDIDKCVLPNMAKC